MSFETPREEKDIIKLKVQVIAGRQLVAKNVNGFSDAYVEIKLINGKQRYKTKTIKKSLNPEWKELFTFKPIEVESDILQFQVWDRSLFSPNFMGQLEIKLSSIETYDDHEKWFTLEGRGKDEEVSGELYLKIYYERYADLIKRYSIEKRL